MYLSFASYCIAPTCRGEAVPPTRFCASHNQAPATQRGGWLSAEKRRIETVQIDASQVAPRLWVGARPPTDRDLPKIDVLVLCAKEIQPQKLAFHGTVIRCPLDDDPIHGVTMAELARAAQTSRTVARALANDGKRVLVTCAMGLNRSAFVASLALGRATTMSADRIIAIMRTRRDPKCLFNEHFVRHIHAIIGSGRKAPTGSDRRRMPRTD